MGRLALVGKLCDCGARKQLEIGRAFSKNRLVCAPIWFVCVRACSLDVLKISNIRNIIEETQKVAICRSHYEETVNPFTVVARTFQFLYLFTFIEY